MKGIVAPVPTPPDTQGRFRAERPGFGRKGEFAGCLGPLTIASPDRLAAVRIAG